jgi:hypothetical protein
MQPYHNEYCIGLTGMFWSAIYFLMGGYKGNHGYLYTHSSYVIEQSSENGGTFKSPKMLLDYSSINSPIAEFGNLSDTAT